VLHGVLYPEVHVNGFEKKKMQLSNYCSETKDVPNPASLNQTVFSSQTSPSRMLAIQQNEGRKWGKGRGKKGQHKQVYAAEEGGFASAGCLRGSAMADAGIFLVVSLFLYVREVL